MCGLSELEMQKGKKNVFCVLCLAVLRGFGLSEQLNMYSRLSTAGELEIMIYLFLSSGCKAGLG